MVCRECLLSTLEILSTILSTKPLLSYTHFKNNVVYPFLVLTLLHPILPKKILYKCCWPCQVTPFLGSFSFFVPSFLTLPTFLPPLSLQMPLGIHHPPLDNVEGLDNHRPFHSTTYCLLGLQVHLCSELQCLCLLSFLVYSVVFFGSVQFPLVWGCTDGRLCSLPWCWVVMYVPAWQGCSGRVVVYRAS